MIKDKRTMEQYMKAGADARLLKEVMNRFISDASPLMYAKEIDKLIAIKGKLDIVISTLDTRLFEDFPETGHEGVDVFYGALNCNQQSDMDESIYRIVRTITKEILIGMEGENK